MTELSLPRFLGAFPRADVPLDPPLPEIAFAGRSNVGKSSLLNALVGRRIAKVSATPGKTRALNVYLIPGSWDGNSASNRQVPHPHAPTPPACYFLDLPGYGYARVSKADRDALGRLVRDALRRPTLTGVVWLLDIRREPSADDQAMQDRFSEVATPVLVALTKSDKLPRAQRLGQASVLRATLGLDDEQLVVTSARTGEGIDELQEAIAGLAEQARRSPFSPPAT